MTDRTTSFEGSQPPLRHRSPSPDDPQYHYDNLNNIAGIQSASVLHTRRRPSRTNSGGKDPPRSPSPPRAKSNSGSGKKTKVARNILKKPPRRDSVHTDTPSATQSGQEEFDEDQSTVGFIPRLGQIREEKASSHSTSRGSSTISSTIEPKARRRRQTGDNALSRSRVRHKHGSLQRRAESLADLSNPSLVSVLSGATQRSSASSGSNSTITQKSYDGYSHMAEHEPPREREGAETEGAINIPMLAEMDVAQPNVFQFLHQGPDIEHLVSEDLHVMPPSTAASSSSSSSGDTHLDDEVSSNTEEAQYVTESPMTSPTSTRRSNYDRSRHGRGLRNSRKPLYASSFVHGPGGQEDEEEEEGSEEYSEDSEAESDEEYDETHADAAHSPHALNYALDNAPPPRVPSTSSRHSDPHTRRLRQQERELANHVLQSPQPHKDFQFGAEPTANVYSPMPLYSPRAYSGASPANLHATAAPVSGWPPMPSMPAPLPIGYSPHRSPEAGHAFPVAVQPPMSAPGNSVQPIVPPFQHYAVQPPLYQPHAPIPDLSKTTVLGYELLADKLSEPLSGSSIHSQAGKMVPMYRKFEHLNHRVLLHLQDEVSELEEELRYLDECIAQTSPRDESGRAYPASRRGDARYGGELHYRRTELLGRIFQKLEQYNQALSSFNNLLRDLDPATTEDVQAYRAWMDKRSPVNQAETRFLEREKDLVAVSRKPSVSTARDAGQHHSAAMWFPLILTLPLMSFAIVPSLLGRLFVIVLIGGAELKLVTSTSALMSFMTVQEWTTAASVYFGLMALLAALVR